MYNGHVCCSLPYSPSPTAPCFSCHKLGSRQEVCRCSSAGNLVKAGCSRGMQIRFCFLLCLEWGALAGSAAGEAGGGELHAQCPGHHNSSWLTPGKAKLAKDEPPVAQSQCTRSCIASSLMASAVRLPNHSCLPLLEGTGQISPFTEYFKSGGGPGRGTAWSTEAIPSGPSQASPSAFGACRDEGEDSLTFKSWAVQLTAHFPQTIRGAMVPLCRLNPVPALGRIYTSSSLLQVRKAHAF